MTQHSPAPWSVKRNRVTVAVLDANKHYVVENVRQQPNQTANVLLIASAPDLLAALKLSAEAFCSLRCPSYFHFAEDRRHIPECDQLRAVIAKAQGEA